MCAALDGCRRACLSQVACIPALPFSKPPAIKDKPNLCCRCSQQRRASLNQRARVESGRHLPKARMMSMGSPLQSLCWHLLMTVLHQAAMVTNRTEPAHPHTPLPHPISPPAMPTCFCIRSATGSHSNVCLQQHCLTGVSVFPPCVYACCVFRCACLGFD